MILLVLLLWLTSIILLITDWKADSNRYLSGVTFFSGCGGLSVIIQENSIPVINSLLMNQPDFALGLAGFLSSLSHHFAPYTLLLYGLSSASLWKVRSHSWRNLLKLILLIPPLLMYGIFPIKEGYYPSFFILTLWVGPYVLLANIFLVLTYFKEKNIKLKQQKLFNCIIVSPITLYALISNYILRIFENHSAWRFHIVLIVIQFVLFIKFSIEHGALGVKIKFERNQIERTMKSISSGTAIINHTIKNEIALISMAAENIKLYCNESNSYIDDSINIIHESTGHLSAMVSRINEQMSDIVIVMDYHNLASIISSTLGMLKGELINRNITVIKNIQYSDNIYCDEIHVREILMNLLKNSIEAMNEDGKITIKALKNKKNITLSITDNGRGISQRDLEHVLDPFFTTKKNSQNFGLGLSYCYNVMLKQGGNLTIESEAGQGTTVTLYFPI